MLISAAGVPLEMRADRNRTGGMRATMTLPYPGERSVNSGCAAAVKMADPVVAPIEAGTAI